MAHIDPIRINGTEAERFASFKFLAVHISEDLSWTLNTSTLIKKAHQRLYFLRRLKKAHLSPQILVNFYHCTIESTPYQLHLSMVWQLLCCGPENTAEGGENRPTHHRFLIPHH